MAEKKQAKPKAKAKPEPKEKAILLISDQPADNFAEVKFYETYEEVAKDFGEPAAVPMTLQYSASDLAAMARAAKAGKADMSDVIAEHDLYLSLVKLGASAPAADVEFVKNHMKYLKTL